MPGAGPKDGARRASGSAPRNGCDLGEARRRQVRVRLQTPRAWPCGRARGRGRADGSRRNGPEEGSRRLALNRAAVAYDVALSAAMRDPSTAGGMWMAWSAYEKAPPEWDRTGLFRGKPFGG